MHWCSLYYFLFTLRYSLLLLLTSYPISPNICKIIFFNFNNVDHYFGAFFSILKLGSFEMKTWLSLFFRALHEGFSILMQLTIPCHLIFRNLFCNTLIYKDMPEFISLHELIFEYS